MEHEGERGDEQRLLFGEDGAKIEEQPVIFNAGDDGDAFRSAAESLLKLRRGIAGAGDANEFCWQRLRRRRAAPGERSAVYDFQLDRKAHV